MSIEIMLLLLMLAVFLPCVLWLKLPVGLSLAATSAVVALAGAKAFHCGISSRGCSAISMCPWCSSPP